jgi:hypothetical protein
MQLVGPDDPIPDAVVVIPQAPTDRFHGDFANIDRPVRLGPHERFDGFVPRHPAPSIPPGTTEPAPPIRTTVWTDSDGKRWQIKDAIRVGEVDGTPKYRGVMLGDDRADVRAFIPLGWSGDVQLFRFLGDAIRRYDDRTVAMQFRSIGSVEYITPRDRTK